MFPIIPFTALYSVFNFIFVSAIPAADDFIHYNDPGCPLVNASSCNDFPWCKRHRHDPDLFDERVGFLNPRDIPEPEDPDLDLKVTREHDVNRKRANNSHYTRHSVQCGTLASVTNDVSAQFQILRPWRLYDLIVDYPYDGATGGNRNPLDLFSPPLNPPVPPFSEPSFKKSLLYYTPPPPKISD